MKLKIEIDLEHCDGNKAVLAQLLSEFATLVYSNQHDDMRLVLPPYNELWTIELKTKDRGQIWARGEVLMDDFDDSPHVLNICSAVDMSLEVPKVRNFDRNGDEIDVN